MAAFAPSDFAQLMGITSGSQGHRSNPFTEEEQKAFYNTVQTVTFSPTPAFWAEFCSQYLPSFFRTFIHTPWVLDSVLYAATVTYSFQVIMQHQYFSKFARENLEEVAASLPIQLSRLSALFEIALAHPDEQADQLSLSSSLGIVLLSSEAYLVHQQHLQSTPVLLTIQEDVISPLRAYRSSFSRLFLEANPGLAPVFEYGQHGLRRLELLMDSGSFQLRRGDPYWHTSLYDWVWRDCEAAGLAETVSKCVEREVGGEMSMCGKCRTVRFCCRDHQRLMWKEHKPTCFETSR